MALLSYDIYNILSLQLLRSSLVNNRTQAEICDDLGLTDYIIAAEGRMDRAVLKTKERADLVEGKDQLICQILMISIA